LTEHAYGAHGVKGATDDLGCPSPIYVVSGLGFEEFGVCENDPKLVVQAMKQCLKVEARRQVVGTIDPLRSAHA